MAEAQAQGADMVMTQGATQSNHARQTAAAAAQLGMACHILLEDRTGSRRPELQRQRQRPARPPARRHDREAHRGARHERRDGGGGRPAAGRGAAGLRHPRRRLEPDRRARLRRLRAGAGGAGERAGPRIDHLVHRHRQRRHPGRPGRGPEGDQRRHPGAGHRRARAAGRSRRRMSSALAAATAEKLGCPGVVSARTWSPTATMSARATASRPRAVSRRSRCSRELEGILLDPVYSGKGAAGLIDLMPQGPVPARARGWCSCTPAARPRCSATTRGLRPRRRRVAAAASNSMARPRFTGSFTQQEPIPEDGDRGGGAR